MNTQLATPTKPAAGKSGNWLLHILRANMVPLMFLALCIGATIASELPLSFVINELVVRLSRNLFLVISLIIPVIAGMGLNFALVIGAMAGQVGLIAVKIWDIGGFNGFLMAILFSTPFAILCGWLTGLCLNKTKGREMITSMILGFFANGAWQAVFLLGIGTVLVVNNPEIVLKGGIGLKNALDYKFLQYSLDKMVYFEVGGIGIPVMSFIAVAVLCWFTRFIVTTKLGQEFRSLGQDLHIAQVAGIPTDKIRLIAITISTVLAAWGQIIFIQNIGTLNTYNSHEQVGMFSIAALLIGGATVVKATITDAIVGTALFHTLFIVSPQAGNVLFGDAQIGEFFRVFIAYGVIGMSLLLHAWHKYMEAKRKLLQE
ncbi:MAG TPA: ABC transporter permease [Selenomonadales bacterium]|nr:ABC transporter permease [Selenomonadales bacterium]